jgi:hypothetical protein
MSDLNQFFMFRPRLSSPVYSPTLDKHGVVSDHLAAKPISRPTEIRGMHSMYWYQQQGKHHRNVLAPVYLERQSTSDECSLFSLA